MISSTQLCEFYQQACEVELQAFKPGNVSIYADGHGMTVADFRVSYQVSGPPLCNPCYSLGEKIYYAVKATREAVGCNTNLGIILLCAPLIQAVSLLKPSRVLRQALQIVLGNTTLSDADWVFKAIALASPGGLGKSEQQDVHNEATMTLFAAMNLASVKDRIAFQYVTNYRDIFDFSLYVYYNARTKWGSQDWAAVKVYADLLTQFPDSHVERKYGHQYTEMLVNKMMRLSKALSEADNAEEIIPMLYGIDQELKSIDVNPGTTADLTVVTVFASLLEDFIAKSS
jgi:triphosphoribosyl-dephospho-CoA synthase